MSKKKQKQKPAVKSKVRIKSYKKAYNKLLLEKQAVDEKFNSLSRKSNQLAPSISALLVAKQIENRALEELAAIRDEIVKYDV